MGFDYFGHAEKFIETYLRVSDAGSYDGSYQIQNSVENWNLSFTGNGKNHGLSNALHQIYNLEDTSLNVFYHESSRVPGFWFVFIEKNANL